MPPHAFNEWTNASILSPTRLINFSMHLQSKKYFHEQDTIIRKACLCDEQNLAANYFKCYATSKAVVSLKDFHTNDSVLESLILFEKWKHLEYFNVAMLETIQKKTSNTLKQNNAFKEQHEIRNKLHDIFVHSLMSIKGYDVLPESFVELFNGDSILSEKVYEDLTKAGVLTTPRVHFKSCMQSVCDQISYNYGISPNVLKSFLKKNKFEYFDNFEALNMKLQAEIQMPSCENFWELLINEGMLVDEIKIVTINVERLKQMDPSLLKVLEECSQEKVTIEMNGRVSLYRIAEKEEENEQELQDKDETKEKKDFELLDSILRMHVPDDIEYEKLKKSQIISSNSIASRCSFCRKELPFKIFDNMSREDFSISEIPESDIDKIIDTLVGNRVIYKSDEKYCLNFESYDGIDDIDMKELQVYKPQIMMLFNRFFIYAFALKKLQNNVAENTGKCFIQLPSQTHMKLMSDLIANHFIEASKVNQDNFDNIENKIDLLYGDLDCDDTLGILTITKFLLMGPISQQLLIFQNLQQLLRPENEKITATAKLTMRNQALLNTKRREIKDLLKTLVSSLRSKESPEINLKHLNFYTQSFENATEIGPFMIKGLDQVMTVDEEKWTWNVIYRFTIIAIVGVLQIVMGSLITVLSVGLMTHVGSSFVNEGIGDLLFAISAITTGHFTWNDYLQHKCISLVMTVLCCGTSSLMTKDQVFLGFGHKVAGPTITKGGEEVAKMGGMRLLKEVGCKKVAGETFKQIINSLLNAARSSLVNFTVEKFMQSRVRSTVESVTQSINGNIHNRIEMSPLSATFEALF